MFASYVTPEEIISRFDIERWAGDDWQNVMRTKIAAARIDVGEDLRQRGFNLSLLSIPLMFDSLESYTTTSNTTYTSAALAGGSVNRFVFDCRTAEQNALVTLQGSHNGTTWEDIPRIDGRTFQLQANEAKIYTDVFPGRYEYYRYTLEGNGSVTYSPFLIDTSTDALVIYRAVMLLLVPYIGDEGPRLLYNEMRTFYDSSMSALRTNYDSDEDGVSDTDTLAKQRVYLVR